MPAFDVTAIPIHEVQSVFPHVRHPAVESVIALSETMIEAGKPPLSVARNRAETRR